MPEVTTAGHPAHDGAGRDHPRFQHHFRDLAQQKDAASLGMWLFLAQEIMFFGGLLFAYTLYRNLYFPAFEFGSHLLDWKLGLGNTIVLIGSSLTMAMGVHSAASGRRKATVNWLLATVLLGSVFLGVKVVEYQAKFEHHLVPGRAFAPHVEGLTALQHEQLQSLKQPLEIYFSLYFAMTGLHALHMIVGIPILLWIAWRARQGEFGAQYHTPVEMVGLYWHFVDIVWIFLFPLLYLIT